MTHRRFHLSRVYGNPIPISSTGITRCLPMPKTDDFDDLGIIKYEPAILEMGDRLGLFEPIVYRLHGRQAAGTWPTDGLTHCQTGWKLALQQRCECKMPPRRGAF